MNKGSPLVVSSQSHMRQQIWVYIPPNLSHAANMHLNASGFVSKILKVWHLLSLAAQAIERVCSFLAYYEL